MARCTLILCLILTLLAPGCADRQEVRPNLDRELGDALAQRPAESDRPATWLEEHPVVKKTATVSLVVVGATVLVVVILVGAFVAGAAIADRHGGGLVGPQGV